MAAKHTPGKPLSPEVKQRIAELTGLDLSAREVAGAVGCSDRSVEKVLSDPEYRKKADDIRRARDSAAAEFSSIVRGMMTATNSDGTADVQQRRIGAELYGKHPGLVDAEQIDSDDGLLPGVILLFPSEAIPYRDAPLVFTDADLADMDAPVAGETGQEAE